MSSLVSEIMATNKSQQGALIPAGEEILDIEVDPSVKWVLVVEKEVADMSRG